MSTVTERGGEIYTYLAAHQGQRFTLGQLCSAVNLHPGAKTTAAIRHARDLATQNGLHFPPAVPQNGYTYTVTSEPLDALEPAAQMDRIATGVTARANVGWDFAGRRGTDLPEHVRAVVSAREAVRRTAAESLRAIDDIAVSLARSLKSDREERGG